MPEFDEREADREHGRMIEAEARGEIGPEGFDPELCPKHGRWVLTSPFDGCPECFKDEQVADDLDRVLTARFTKPHLPRMRRYDQ